MQNINVTSRLDEIQNEKVIWAKFPNIGDRIEGTYVDFFDGKTPDQKKPDGTLVKEGTPQMVYVFEQDNGARINLGEALSHKIFIEGMQKVNLGQYVRVVYVANGKVAVMGNFAKIKQIITDPMLVNSDWVEKNKEFITMKQGHETPVPGSMQTSCPSVEAPVETQQEVPQLNTEEPLNIDIPSAQVAQVNAKTDVEKMAEIASIGKSLGATSADDIRNMVADKLKIAYTKENLDAIIEGLTKLKNEPPF